MYADLKKYGTVRYNEPLANHCTWRIGGSADILIEPSSKESLAELISILNKSQSNLLVIGAGSKLLFDDKGVRGVVIKIGYTISRVEIEGNKAICQSGIWLPFLARKLCNSGLSGLEHAVGIPGSLGGLVAMNGGSQHQFIGKNVEYVEAIASDGSIRRVSNTQCRFGYRSSAFQDGRLIIAEVCIVLNPSDHRSIRREMLDILKERRRKFPLKQPSCGSVFLSNSDNYDKIGAPGSILDKMGLKGFRVGGAQVSDLHANFIINTGNATSQDVLDLVDAIREKVCERFALDLQCEFRYVSEDGQIRKPCY
jgi:UDP-N-acetylmuramate dehydrogenase